MIETSVPEIRVRNVNGGPVDTKGAYVLYWMIAHRRLDRNFALQHAVDAARELGVSLIILEALRCDYPHASRRLHRFVLDGMADHERRLEGTGVLYHPYVEPAKGAGKGLLAALAEGAALVVTDDYPYFFLPRMIDAAGERLSVRLAMVDSNGLLPMRAVDRVHATAHGFRAFLQKTLPEHLERMPRVHPLQGGGFPARHRLPEGIVKRWPRADLDRLRREGGLADLPIDHEVGVVETRGGPEAGRRRLDRFLDDGLDRYGEEARQPDAGATSGLSPYLHFGHVSAHGVFEEVMERAGWSLDDLAEPLGGKRSGWWGVSESVESFLDQLVTWRELGFNMACRKADVSSWSTLPDWARDTLEEHAGDERPHIYQTRTLEEGRTDDEIWNAAQGQLLREGAIHNYMRMLWGKKVITWTDHPRRALEILFELNDRYALDGRDPNSASGITWCFGRYDRPWGPERPIYGKVRIMKSESTRKKLRLDDYLERY